MKILFSSILSLSVVFSAVSQEARILPVAQEMPTLEACASITDFAERRTCTDAKIEAALAEHLQYPDAAKQAGVDGFVIVRFIVDEKGKAIEYGVDEDPGYGMGEAAIKAVKKLGKWVPGRNRGEAVKVRMSVPVKFKMPEVKTEEKPVMPDVHDFVEQMPRYQGCEGADDAAARNCTHQSIAKYIRANLKYPEAAQKQNVSGTVIVKFVITETGMITDPQVQESLGAGCDEEAIRLVQAMPQWTPGMQGGKPVKVRMKLPFQFVPTANE